MVQRILVVLARKVCRQGLCQFLASLPNVSVAGEAADGRDAVLRARELHPDITILETSLPGLNGVEATHQLVAECPEMAVIAVSAGNDFAQMKGMLHAGARGFVLTSGGVSEIADAIRAVADGHVYLSPAVEDRMVTSLDRFSATPVSLLSAREREVLQLLAEGKSTRRIAEILGVSTKTIETHRQHITRKLNIHSIAELTKYAIRNGITSLS
jgi:DNA-binding NarL/FixJ family response regulator